MKKVMFAAAAFAVLGLASCKKDYSCECVTKEGTTTLETTTTTITGKKKDVEAACNSLSSTVFTVTKTCTIK